MKRKYVVYGLLILLVIFPIAYSQIDKSEVSAHFDSLHLQEIDLDESSYNSKEIRSINFRTNFTVTWMKDGLPEWRRVGCNYVEVFLYASFEDSYDKYTQYEWYESQVSDCMGVYNRIMPGDTKTLLFSTIMGFEKGVYDFFIKSNIIDVSNLLRLTITNSTQFSYEILSETITVYN